MSMRTHFIGLKSIEPLREVVGSGNDALAARLTTQYRNEVEEEWGDLDDLDEDDLEEVQEGLDEFAGYVSDIMQGETESGLEPGAWVFVFKMIIDDLKLGLPGGLSINKGYKHSYAWQPYRQMLAKSLTPASVTSLQHIENGRPMKSDELDHDGCAFAWLTPAEVAELQQSLAKVSQSAITNADLQEFHNDLVQSLKTLADQQAALFVVAH